MSIMETAYSMFDSLTQIDGVNYVLAEEAILFFCTGILVSIIESAVAFSLFYVILKAGTGLVHRFIWPGKRKSSVPLY